MAFIHDPYRIACRDDDILYLTGNNHLFTSAGYMDDEYDMPEDKVKEFIEYCKPDLFTQLHGLPISSRDIPMSFYGQRSLRRSGQIAEKNGRHASGLDTPNSSEESVPLETATDISKSTESKNAAPLASQPSPFSSNSGNSSSEFSPADVRRLDPNHVWAVQKAREIIAYKLKNGFFMYRKVSLSHDHLLSCSFSFCQHGSSISHDKAYISLEYDYQTENYDHTISKEAQNFCDDCFDIIFTPHFHLAQGYTITPNRTSPERISTAAETHLLSLDGVSHDTILNAATRLYPKLPPTRYDPNVLKDNRGRPDAAFNYASNSSQALLRRAAKNQEINAMLSEVAKYEKAIATFRRDQEESSFLHSQRENSSDVSVLITRPVCLEPPKERYKKQGLTKVDQTKYREKVKQEEHESDEMPEKPLVSPTINRSMHPKERYCYCREGELPDTEMIRCASEWCPVGWFHLSCTGLNHLPNTKEPFRCYYCTDDLGPFVSEKMMDQDESSIIVEMQEQENVNPVGYAGHDQGRIEKEGTTGTTNHLQTTEIEDMEEDIDTNTDYDFSWSATDAVLHSTINSWGIAVNRSQAKWRHNHNDNIESEVELDTELESGINSPNPASTLTGHSLDPSSFTDIDEDTATEIDDEDQDNDITDNTTDDVSACINARDEDSDSEHSEGTVRPDLSVNHHHHHHKSSTTTSPSQTSIEPQTPTPPNCLRTPSLAPILISSKPWGTPVNLDRLIFEPVSPSPNPKSVKRKFDSFTQVSTNGRDNMSSVSGIAGDGMLDSKSWSSSAGRKEREGDGEGEDAGTSISGSGRKGGREGVEDEHGRDHDGYESDDEGEGEVITVMLDPRILMP